jgi:hypothetical protein
MQDLAGRGWKSSRGVQELTHSSVVQNTRNSNSQLNFERNTPALKNDKLVFAFRIFSV